MQRQLTKGERAISMEQQRRQAVWEACYTLQIILNKKRGPGVVAHTCNPSYTGDRDEEIKV
jgi:hypothetical protein